MIYRSLDIIYKKKKEEKKNLQGTEAETTYKNLLNTFLSLRFSEKFLQMFQRALARRIVQPPLLNSLFYLINRLL